MQHIQDKDKDLIIFTNSHLAAKNKRRKKQRSRKFLYLTIWGSIAVVAICVHQRNNMCITYNICNCIKKLHKINSCHLISVIVMLPIQKKVGKDSKENSNVPKSSNSWLGRHHSANEKGLLSAVSGPSASIAEWSTPRWNIYCTRFREDYFRCLVRYILQGGL